jgi:AbrB family looped-hinge helix DNA binding protein
VDTAGRVLIPASVRSHHNIKVGDILAIVSHPDGVELRTKQQIIREAQDYFRSLAPASRILSEELIAERRREAEAE